MESKFITPSIYGILRSGSIILKKIATALDEPIQVKNTIDRLSQNLNRPISKDIQLNYTNKMVNVLGEQPVILVDDSDVIKPYGEKFESLGRVRDGFSKDKKIEKGFHVTEMVYVRHLNIQITASKKPVTLVLVYGLGMTPMMLATLAYAREGIQRWFCIRSHDPRQLELKLAV